MFGIIEARTFVYRVLLKYSNITHMYAWNTQIEQSFLIPENQGSR